ncbi:MAG: twin-arginine translocation signal domain-containing protein, partial [Gammaproteobacteria bacterium]|nr:twin-arginine translocation signal domain-containing protein [Gammaproteobacteria bacterium]
MSSINDPTKGGVCLTRRRFVQGVAMGGAFAGLGLGSSALAAVISSRVRRHRLIPLTEPYVRTTYTAP